MTEQARFCSNCNFHIHIPGGAHLQHCTKYLKDGNPQPCVGARPNECQGGEGWELGVDSQ